MVQKSYPPTTAIAYFTLADRGLSVTAATGASENGKSQKKRVPEVDISDLVDTTPHFLARSECKAGKLSNACNRSFSRTILVFRITGALRRSL
jgi:hypothetical protein